MKNTDRIRAAHLEKFTSPHRFPLPEPKFPYDWCAEQGEGTTSLRWMSESGPGRAELPTWLIDRLVEARQRQKGRET